MQHVLRCWERQSDGTEYKKTLRRPGLRPDPAGELTALLQTPYLAAPPQESPLSANRALPLLPHSKISSDVVGCN